MLVWHMDRTGKNWGNVLTLDPFFDFEIMIDHHLDDLILDVRDLSLRNLDPFLS
jgi:hypothetical protein